MRGFRPRRELVVAGDAIDDVQLRNLTFQTQMGTLEEGAVDLDVGIEVLGKTNAPHGLAVPVLVHVDYDERIRAPAPGRKHVLVVWPRRSRPGMRVRPALLASSPKGSCGARPVAPRGGRVGGRRPDELAPTPGATQGGTAMKIFCVEDTLVATARIGKLQSQRLLVVGTGREASRWRSTPSAASPATG